MKNRSSARRSLLWPAALALAIGSFARPAAAANLVWKGHTWQVTSGAMAGACQGDPSNVTVDSSGYLHFKITNTAGTWTASEMFTADTLGFGTYQWQVDGPIDKYDKNIVLGLFPYGPAASIGADGTNEIDIEYSRWGQTNGPNGDWTDYPNSGTTIGELSFNFTLASTLSTSRFIWTGASIQSFLIDGLQPVGSTTSLIKTWTYAPQNAGTNIPQSAMPVGMNLWCFNGPPSNGQPIEIVIRDFQFVPAGASSGAGGAGGAGVMGATGGTTGTGGVAGTTGAGGLSGSGGLTGGTGGGASSGGPTGGTGGTGGGTTSSGGAGTIVSSSGTGGVTSTAGSAGATEHPSDQVSSDGCSCGFVGGRRALGGVPLALALLALALHRRRVQSTSSIRRVGALASWFVASAVAMACGSSTESPANSGVGSGGGPSTGSTHSSTSTGSVGSSTTSAGNGTTGVTGGTTSAGATTGAGGTTSAGATTGAGGTSTVSSSVGATAGSTGSGGSSALWSPSSSAPIHFHWMIGDFSSTNPSDILSNQSGQVVYDIDGEGATAADVAAIHAAGAIAVCYVDVGTLEKGRSDYNQFPSSVLGPILPDWPDENWLLVTAENQSILLPLMQARFTNWCQAKGFDAIEPDNLDGWTNISGITKADNLAYDLAIGKLAHSMSISIGLKNLATDLGSSDFPSFLATFDWALNEQCYENNECDAYTQAGSFIPAGKAVFDVEYDSAPDCTQADQAHINAEQTDLDLVGAHSSGYSYTPCIPDTQTAW